MIGVVVMKVIGFLNSASPGSFSQFADEFRKGLKNAGYIEDQDVKIVLKWANGNYDELPKLAADLVKRKVDLIAATGGAISAQAAMRATDTIPIIFAIGFNPTKMQFVGKSMGHADNATGVNVSTTESVPARVKLLRQMVPNAKKIAVLLRPDTQVFKREKEQAANEGLIVVQATTVDEFEKAFASAVKKKADALVVCADPFFTSQRKKIVALAKQYGLPAAYPFREYVEAGGLMSYGPDLTDVYRHVGEYAGKILGGTKPSELRVQMRKLSEFEFFVNAKAAKALDLELPQALRKRSGVI
jgi:putative ABC transport system substrate-binding protein